MRKLDTVFVGPMGQPFICFCGKMVLLNMPYYGWSGRPASEIRFVPTRLPVPFLPFEKFPFFKTHFLGLMDWVLDHGGTKMLCVCVFWGGGGGGNYCFFFVGGWGVDTNACFILFFCGGGVGGGGAVTWPMAIFSPRHIQELYHFPQKYQIWAATKYGWGLF